MSDYEYEDDDFVSPDFAMLIDSAQRNELAALEKAREREREAQRKLNAANSSQAMTLSQIIGLKSQKELDQEAAAKLSAEEKKDLVDETKRKENAKQRLANQFPPPE